MVWQLSYPGYKNFPTTFTFPPLLCKTIKNDGNHCGEMRGMTLKSQGYCTKAAWLVTLYVAVNKENRHADLQITLSNV